MSDSRGVLMARIARKAKSFCAAGLVLFAGQAFVSLSAPIATAQAQDASNNELLKKTNPNAQMLLQADQLIYDNDTETVSASGNVQIDYDGNNLVADRVIYNQQTGRVKASGNVEIRDKDGNRFYTQSIDITDDFGEGFINALRVETAQDTRFAAESAERFAGQKTVFNHGVYTACKPCQKNPGRAPLWQVKASTIILDGKKKTVTYRHARFELYGLPIAYLPYFRHADPSVKRKTGFLTPRASFSNTLGFGYSQAFFWVTGQTHDLTFNGTYYTKQGFLPEAEWRQRFDNGYYKIQVAGIIQKDPTVFSLAPDNVKINRGLVASEGEFNINPYWTFGWDVLAQSDATFGRTYKIGNYGDYYETSNVHLRGLRGRSYFDLSAYKFWIQDHPTAFAKQDEQAFVRPSLDYNFIKSKPVFGGQLSLDINATSLQRRRANIVTLTPGVTRHAGLAGDSTRLSVDAEWKRTFNNTMGMMLTPSLSLRGDAFFVNASTATSPANLSQGSHFRGMPTLGLEYRWPILVRAGTTAHVFEPIAQLFVRPNIVGNKVLPNEDAQSLVFDTTNLFSRDKFSGYDRIESGSRANIGLRYSGLFANGWNINAMAGQSYHLTGRNPYASTGNLVNAGLDSGLETRFSDFVGSAGIAAPRGQRFETRARFDNSNFGLKRLEATASFTSKYVDAAAGYVFIAAQPNYGFNVDRKQARANANIKFHENWSLSGAVVFDVINNARVSETIGLAYHDECFTFSLAFTNARNRFTTEQVTQSVSLKVSFRTLGSFQTGTTLGQDLTSGF